MNPSSSVRRAPLDLWRIAQAFLNTLHMLFGEPKDVARNSVVSALVHRQLASWLACAEALMRRLLLIEAAALPIPNTRPRQRAPRQRVRKPREFWADEPEDWRVSFRCFVSSPACGGGSRERARDGGGDAAPSPASIAAHRPLGHAARDSSPARGGANQFRNAWPLAERYEAVLRVFENPEPYARRLAHRLRAAPLNASKLLQAPPDYAHRVERADELTHAAARDRDRFCDSS